MKKILSLTLILCLALCGVASADIHKVAWSSDMPFFPEKRDLTIGTIRPANHNAWDAKWFYHWIPQAMNLNLDVIEIGELERNEKLNLLFASDDLPDIFYNCALTETEISMYGLKEKQLLPLNDLIDQYAPNIKAFLEMEPKVAAGLYHVDGNIYMLPGYIGYNRQEDYTTLRAWINQKWLANLGLENPDTLEGFTEVLKAFKAQDANGNGDPNDEIPLSDTLPNITRLMLNLMGAMTRDSTTLRPAILNAEPIVPANNKEFYRAYLTLLNRLYAQGLIDQDVFTLTLAQMQANASEDVVGVHVQAAPHVMPTPDWSDWISVKPMTGPYCDQPKWPESNRVVHGMFALSYQCEDAEAAMKFADWHFTQQGALYTWFGPQADSPDTLGEIGGWFYDEETQAIDFNFPDGVTQQIDYINLIVPGTHTHVGISAPNEAIETLLGHELPNKTSGAPKWWREQMDANCVPFYSACYPSLYFGDAQTDRITELETPLSDYITIMEAKFISGESSLDSFDAYYEDLQSMGLSEYEGYFKEAYLRYQSNL